jgi:uncharacterized protein (DUF2062 family)
MAKGDDALAKKKNKAIRKRNRRAGVDTTEFAEGVKAHKRRRKLGTRRVCEVCCFLPVSAAAAAAAASSASLDPFPFITVIAVITSVVVSLQGHCRESPGS